MPVLSVNFSAQAIFCASCVGPSPTRENEIGSRRRHRCSNRRGSGRQNKYPIHVPLLRVPVLLGCSKTRLHLSGENPRRLHDLIFTTSIRSRILGRKSRQAASFMSAARRRSRSSRLG